MVIHPTGPPGFGTRFGNQAPTGKKLLRFFALERECFGL